LIALPYLQGERTPVWDEGARGCFFGLDLAQGRGHLYRALLEGVALGFRHCMAVAEEQGLRFAEVVAADGAGRSALLRQTLADALGVPVTWSSEGGGTLAGAAILAGLGAGVIVSAQAASGGAWRPRATVRHEPDARAHARLRSVFARRLELYEAVRAATF
jgi:xylulokinase